MFADSSVREMVRQSVSCQLLEPVCRKCRVSGYANSILWRRSPDGTAGSVSHKARNTGADIIPDTAIHTHTQTRTHKLVRATELFNSKFIALSKLCETEGDWSLEMRLVAAAVLLPSF